MRHVFLFIFLFAHSGLAIIFQCCRFVDWNRSSTCKHQHMASVLRHSPEFISSDENAASESDAKATFFYFTGMQVGVFRVDRGYRDVCTVRYFSPPAQVSALCCYLPVTCKSALSLPHQFGDLGIV